MKTPLLLIGIVIIIGVFVFLPKSSNKSLPVSATLKLENGKEIGLRVADEPKEREFGLSYFKSFPQDQGMLFIFDKPGVYPFWMKDMNFPLDIIWLKRGQDGGYRVIYVAENVLPSSYPNSISPKIEADAVLEINSGLASVYNLDLEKILWITFKK